MATVDGMTADAINALVNALVQTGNIDDSGNLTLTTHDGTVLNLGSVISSIPTASTAAAGIIAIASSSDVTAGTDTSKAITPAELAGVSAALATSIGGKQTSNTDLTTISGLTPANNDVLQRKSGAWANRTLAQLITDLLAAGGIQPSNAALTAIAGLTPAASDVIQYESGAWSHRTPTQLAADLVAAVAIVKSQLYSGSAWAASTGAQVYVGTVDPSLSQTITNGAVWFDTSGS